MRRVTSLVATLVLCCASACGDDETGTNTSPSTPTVVVLVSETSVAAGDQGCEGGGTQFDVGLDNGDGEGTASDGVLQAGEIDETQVVCADDSPGDPGALAVTTTLPEGDDECPNGGTQLDEGQDNGDGEGVAGDGQLQAGEIDSTDVYCLAGDAGSDILTSSQTLDPGDDDCPLGGERVDYGRDDGAQPDDGMLQGDEIEDSLFVCAAGAGDDLLTNTTSVGIDDENCPLGGTRLDYGYDDGAGEGTASDMTLSPDEVEGSDYLCNTDVVLDMVDLPIGDERCPSGGQLVTSGDDDGGGEGVADDGLLHPDEVDITVAQCDVAVEDVFTLTEGTEGELIIDLRGGDADETPGSGGDATIEILAGPMPAFIELRQLGELPDFEVPEFTPALGANAFTCSPDDSPCLITAWDGEDSPPDGIYYDYSDGMSPHQLYDDDDEVVTGLTVLADAILIIGTDDGDAYIEVPNDIVNRGTISPQTAGALEIRCGSFFNTVDGRVSTIDSDESGDLEIEAVLSDTGVLVNAGEIWTRGGDGPGEAGDMSLVARSDVVNTGELMANGYEGMSHGGEIDVRSFHGDIYHTGIIDTSAGPAESTGGYDGGDVHLSTRTGEVGFISSDISNDPQGPGSVYVSGSIWAAGSDNDDSSDGGEGGEVTLEAHGGDVLFTGSIDTSGGSALVDGAGGDGDEVSIVAYLFIDESTGAVTVPTSIDIAGNIDTSGGGASEYEPGGDGGELTIRLNLVAEVDSFRSFRDPPPPFNVAALSTLGAQPASIRLLGFGGEVEGRGFVSRGGSQLDEIEGDLEVSAGSVEIRIGSCPPEPGWPPIGGYPAPCLVDRTGPRWIYNDVDFDLAAGVLLAGDAEGDRNELSMTINGGDNPLSAVVDETRIENHGDIDLTGLSSETFSGGPGGDLVMRAVAGSVVHTGKLTLDGGLGCLTCDTNEELGLAGNATFVGWTLILEGDLAAIGDGGASIDLYGLDALISGRLGADGGEWDFGDAGVNISASSGGNVFVSLAGTLDITGEIDVSGADVLATTDAPAGSAGDVWVIANIVTVSGTIDASGGHGDAAEGEANGGHGGHIGIQANDVFISSEAELLAFGGDAAAIDTPTGARGGAVEILTEAAVNEGLIDVSGGSGDFTSLDSGDSYGHDAGSVLLVGDNSGTILAVGGGAVGGDTQNGGDGGEVEVTGDNTGCIDVSAGPDATDGSVDVGGTDSGSCE